MIIPQAELSDPATSEATGVSEGWPASVFALALGMAMTLALSGYQFGESNHSVYLLDALRRTSPGLLRNDWFTTQTLQYHAIFGLITQWLWQIGFLQTGFLVGYLLTVAFFHLGWLRIVRCLGGSVVTYLVSVLLFQISAGGTGLGMYQFIQDGSFLPSNLASVAMLWGLYFWLKQRFAWSGLMLGLAGLFHLNFAVAGIGMWGALSLFDILRQKINRIDYLSGTAACLVPSAANIVYALLHRPTAGTPMPLPEFVDLYAKLRHPHHYDPSSWPAALWLAFLWPIPLAAMTARRRLVHAWHETRRIVMILLALQLVALLGAGIWYVSETLIQLSLFRFSIYIKLFTCVGAAFWINDLNVKTRFRASMVVACLLASALFAIALLPLPWPLLRQPGVFLFLALSLLLILYGIARPTNTVVHVIGIAILAITVLLAWPRSLGLHLIPEDDANYLKLCQWIADPAHTPVDAVFLVPPAEFAMRLEGRRAIVVNFKGVPQFSAEMPAWRDRLKDVLELNDLRQVPRGWPVTLPYLRDRYESRSAEHLFEVARKYNARFIIVGHRLRTSDDSRLRFANENGSYFLYDLAG